MTIELIGYLGSALVVVSMLMTSVMKLRIINTIGSIIFASYAFMIKSYPTAFMNIALVIINLINMRKLSTTSNSYSMVECKAGESFVSGILDKYGKDIAQFFPGFTGLTEGESAYVIMNDDQLAGITAGTVENGNLRISLDYSTPVYRDCSVGKFLLDRLAAAGIKSVSISNPTETHKQYLDKLGYTQNGSEYTKTL